MVAEIDLGANKPTDLDGNAPDHCSVALILIDVINDFSFPQGRKLLPYALSMARALRKLVQNAREMRIPVIYVNDNFGKWHSDFSRAVETCSHPDALGKEVVKMLEPQAQDYKVLKLKHSAFYGRPLDSLLHSLGAKHLIFTGMLTESCVLFTAADAYFREYRITAPPDCLASFDLVQKKMALHLMKSVLKANVKNSRSIDLLRLVQERD